MIPYFLPRESIGGIHFNEQISKYVEGFNFNYYPKEGEGYEVYEIAEIDLSIYVEDNKIESINCKAECLWQGRNMIGMEINDFLNYYDLTPDAPPEKSDFEEDDIPQLVYEFDEIDLQVWTKKGIIVTVIASNFVDDE